MRKNIAFAFLLLSIVFVSCDQEYNTVGADLVGDEHFDFDKYVIEDNDLKAYTLATGEVQTNNLPLNPLGFYNNPYFGQTKANFVTQLSLNTFQPNFGTNVQIENVTLYIPYFSTVDETNDDGSKTYKLDSIFGANPESKMKLSVYENGYYLSSFDANDQSLSAKYYNDMDGLIDAQKRGVGPGGTSIANGARLNDDNSNSNAQNDQFFFNKEEIIVYKRKFNPVSGELDYLDENDNVTTDPTKYVVKERLAPGIYLNLNKQFFKKMILEASANDLYNHNTFKQYFKGLYFQMEQVAGQEGAMALLNFSNAKLNVNYYSISSGATEATSKTFLLSMGANSNANSSNTVSLQDFSYTGTYNTELANNADFNTGQNSRLLLKGGEGSVAYIEISQAKIDELKTKNWLINDAYLEFYVDKTAMSASGQEEAERIYLFDATNQKVLYDCAFDNSTSTNPKNNKAIYGGIIKRDSNKKGEKYKIRITQHIHNILNSTNVNVNKNVKLGLCVTESVLVTSNFYLKNPFTFGPGTEDDIKYFPVASIMSQQGTVLHGTASSDPDKKLRLVIHYTKPN